MFYTSMSEPTIDLAEHLLVSEGPTYRDCTVTVDLLSSAAIIIVFCRIINRYKVYM